MTIAELLEKIIAAQQATIRIQEVLLEVRAQLDKTSGEIIDSAATQHAGTGAEIGRILDALTGGDQ